MSATFSDGRLAPASLRRRCDPEQFAFRTTAELADHADALGQERALDAIRFGVDMARDGYNIFAMGPEGMGRRTMVRRLLETRAASRPSPPDCCHVFNFQVPEKPGLLQLPAGCATHLVEAMKRLVEDLRAGIPAALETDEYRARRDEIESEFGEGQERRFSTVAEHARSQGVALLRTPAGFGFAPLAGDAVIAPEEFQKLPAEQQAAIQQKIGTLQGELEKVIQEVPRLRRQTQDRLRALHRQVTGTVVRSLMEDVREKLAQAFGAVLPQVVRYLDEVQEDVLDHLEFFQPAKEGEAPVPFALGLARAEQGESPLRRYAVTLLVAHAQGSGAPVVYEDNPTYGNLLGRVEHVARMGALITDFTLIRPGALQRANGGYLILDALKVLSQPFAWEALKRALRSREARIESPGQAYSLISTVALEPQPIPLDVKVVLVGQRALYYLLQAHDPEFPDLFKVAADFEEHIEREAGSDEAYARVVATLARSEGLRALDRAAVARVIEQGAREAGDADRLSVQMRGLCDLVREADHWCAQGGRDIISDADVQQALDAQQARSDRVRSELQRQVLRGTLLIDTAGRRAGQINGLAVMQLGGFAFGMPHRITASVRYGNGQVVDIEREANLGGPLHSKGVMILCGFLSGRYAPSQPLSLQASLVFEQSYGGVEGDSASSAELYALLSALADAPIRQGLAVTGSVNQFGDVQAIGGVNEKIEGYFDLCRMRGLTGEEGVLIPASNVKHLMLRQDVVDAVEAGRFAVHAVSRIDQGIAILTGLPAGERQANGRYPQGSVNGRVEARLAGYAGHARGAAGAGKRVRAWRAPETK